MQRLLVLGLAALLSVALGSPAWAVTFGFENITNNNATDAAIGEAQLFVDVTQGPGANQVLFTFSNTGPAASSITDVYFDDGTLLGIAEVINGPGVNFSQGASPPNLPGANNASPPFQTTAGFLADSDPPTQPNGVNPGESLGILFTLQGGQTLADTLNAIADGSLRIGIHVQGFASGGSESFVNTPNGNGNGGVIPEPSSLAIAGLGLLGLALKARRKKRAGA